MPSIPLDQVIPNPDQPRKRFDPDALAELAASIKVNGLLQPISVRPLADGRYMIVGGERRWRAHQLAGLPTIDANVVDVDETQMAVLAIIENLQRADITPLEEAAAFQRMVDRGFSVEDLAERLGIRQPWRIRDRLQLLRLEPEYLTLLRGGHLSPSQAFELSRLSPDGQRRLFQQLKAGRLDTYNKLRAAADAILAAESQSGMFDPAPVSEEDQERLTRLEAKIERVAEILARGFDDGEVTILRKVNPHRAALLVEQVRVMSKALAMLERQLVRAAAQLEIAA